MALFGSVEQSTPVARLESEDGGGRLIAAAHARSLFVSSGTDRTVRIWRTPGPRLARSYRGLAEDITAIDVSPDASNLASGASDGVVRIWPNPAQRPWRVRTVHTLKAHDGGVTAVALGPAGTLATAGADGSVKVWSLRPAPVARSLAQVPGAHLELLTGRPPPVRRRRGRADTGVVSAALPTVGAT